MPPATDTKDHILRSAIEVLQAQGTEGLTMRKVAAKADMSLGNLQYHYPNKTSLMAGLAEHYFETCSTMLDGYRHTPRGGSREAQLRQFVLSLLDHVDHEDGISDMCRIFREMWALSARDSDIHRQLVAYYQATIARLVSLLMPISSSETAANEMACLLLPYLEGYSITCKALPLGKEETARMLTALCRPFLG